LFTLLAINSPSTLPGNHSPTGVFSGFFMEDIMIKPPPGDLTICPYCGSHTHFVPSALVYGRNTGNIVLACTSCNAYSACHEGTMIPKGTLANPVLRELRRKTHGVFDPIWRKDGIACRSIAYKALARLLQLPEVQIGWLDEQQCIRVINKKERLRNLAEQLQAKHDGRIANLLGSIRHVAERALHH
jgi:hypothetical protein